MPPQQQQPWQSGIFNRINRQHPMDMVDNDDIIVFTNTTSFTDEEEKEIGSSLENRENKRNEVEVQQEQLSYNLQAKEDKENCR